MAGGITGIDHVLIQVDDLEAARIVYQRLGFTPTPRGRHPQWGTGNYCLMFPDDYLELIGVVDQAEYDANAANRAPRRADQGLAAIALANDDAEAAKASLAAAGIEADGPKDLSRLLESDEGVSEPRFHILHLAPDVSPAIPMFLCRHLTPDLVRRPDWTTHRNGARRIRSIAVPVDHAPSLVEPYQRLFGRGAVTPTDNVVAVRTGGASILFAGEEDLEALYPDLLPDPGQAPLPAVITLEVDDLDLTGRVLADAGFPLARDARAVMIAAEDVCGVALVFTG
jgi:catechol 2,3-dioxygenase-like lactoylglutathione lyase family enzyme